MTKLPDTRTMLNEARTFLSEGSDSKIDDKTLKKLEKYIEDQFNVGVQVVKDQGETLLISVDAGSKVTAALKKALKHFKLDSVINLKKKPNFTS
jgi:hypothetical protein